MSAIKRCPLAAFTITELLVVIALVVALIVILIPAINTVRDSSRTTRCSANQYSLSLAFNEFDSRNGSLPGWRHGITLPGGSRWAPFVFPLLPFFDQADVFNAYMNGTTTPPSSFEIDTLQCPTVGVTGGYNPGRGDYGSNFGTGHGTAWLAQQEGQTAPFRPFKDDGALADVASGQSQSLAGIVAGDGTSMTLLTSEVARNFWLPSGANCFSNVVYQGQMSGCMVFGHTVQAAGTAVIPTVSANMRIINNPGLGMAPRSLHVNGVMASFADGSTRFLTNSLAAHVYAHLVTSRSVFSSSSPITYANNSRNANSYLRAPPAPAIDFKVTEQDLK